jgi:HTH-type transcriptional regulator/antitoxin HigA
MAVQIKPVRTQRDYEATLRAIEALMMAKRGTPDGDRLDVLFVMEQRDLTVKDLVPFIGQPNRVYELEY